MPSGELTITVYPEWWLRIISGVLLGAHERGYHPPMWFVDFYCDVLMQHGLRMSPSEHTKRYNRRVL
jgi:hypothetical protein